MYKQDKATTERHARILRELVKRPENKVCADCKRNGTYLNRIIINESNSHRTLDARWASWNMFVDILSMAYSY